MVSRQSAFDFFLYSMILFCSMTNSLLAWRNLVQAPRLPGKIIDNLHKTEVKVSIRNNLNEARTEAGLPSLPAEISASRILLNPYGGTMVGYGIRQIRMVYLVGFTAVLLAGGGFKGSRLNRPAKNTVCKSR
jgi:hypothetical protein